MIYRWDKDRELYYKILHCLCGIVDTIMGVILLICLAKYNCCLRYKLVIWYQNKKFKED